MGDDRGIIGGSHRELRQWSIVAGRYGLAKLWAGNGVLPFAQRRFSTPGATKGRHGRACPGHPRLTLLDFEKTWMPATSAGMAMLNEETNMAAHKLLLLP